MEQTIEFEQERVDKINDCLTSSKNGAQMQAYAEAGAKMRETCEHFASVVLDAFIGEGISRQYSTLDERIKALKEYKCLNKDEINLLYDVKSYGNNAVHSGKSKNFNVTDIEKLLPKFEELISSYISGLDSKYEQFLTRKASGEIELFQRIDGCITEAMSEVTKKWIENVEKCEESDIPKFYDRTPLLPGPALTVNEANKIKKDLYLAAKNLMAIVCELHNVDADDQDYFDLLENVKKIEHNYYKDSSSYEDSFINFREPQKLSNAKINSYEPYNAIRGKGYFVKNASAIQVKGAFSNDITRLYDVTICRFPKGLRDENKIKFYETANYDLSATRNGKTGFAEGPTREIAYFARVEKICRDAFFDGKSWDAEIYGYLYMLYDAVENIKMKYDARYKLNDEALPFIQAMNLNINKIENKSLEEVIVKREELLEKQIESLKLENQRKIAEEEAKVKELRLKEEAQKLQEKEQDFEAQRLKMLKIASTGIYLVGFTMGTYVFFTWFIPMVWYGKNFFIGFALGILLMVLFRGLKIWDK